MVQISRAIVHEIPRGRYSADGSSKVGYSDAETALAAVTKRFIEENMLDFSMKSHRRIVEDASAGSTTPELVRKIIASPESFINASQEIALNLHRAQTGNSPSGILIVAIVEDQDTESVLIMKAEHAQGMRLRRVETDGAGHFDLEHLNELIVGNNSRVYKIAILHEGKDAAIGRMVDQQNGVAFAEFFMSTFLGCRLVDEAEVQTRNFLNSAMGWINKSVYDEEEKGQYATALLAYMAAPSGEFQPSEFAERFLAPERRDDFLNALPESVPDVVVKKDLALVPGRGAGMRMYGAGVMISASADALNNGGIEILSEDTGSTTIRIRGALRKYEFGQAPKP